MGFFDALLGKKTNNKNGNDNNRRTINNNDDINKDGNNSTIDIFSPKSFEDVAVIIDTLLEGKPAIVHLSEVRENTAQRVIDLLSGAVYAINGNLCELKKDVYIFTPNGVKIN